MAHIQMHDLAYSHTMKRHTYTCESGCQLS